MPSAFQLSDLSSTEFDGRAAGVGKSALVSGAIGILFFNKPSARASSCIATAKSYQLATPASVQWKIPVICNNSNRFFFFH